MKRGLAVEYIQNHPDASQREVAENTPVSQPTVGKIKKELEEDSQSDSKASDTGTQTDEEGDEGEASSTTETDSEE